MKPTLLQAARALLTRIGGDSQLARFVRLAAWTAGGLLAAQLAHGPLPRGAVTIAIVSGFEVAFRQWRPTLAIPRARQVHVGPEHVVTLVADTSKFEQDIRRVGHLLGALEDLVGRVRDTPTAGDVHPLTSLLPPVPVAPPESPAH